MATLTISLTIGATTRTNTITSPDARMTEFLDDIIARWPEAGLTTRAQAGQFFVNTLGQRISNEAKELKRMRLAAAVTPADDLEGTA